jgi:hypothetical protein
MLLVDQFYPSYDKVPAQVIARVFVYALQNARVPYYFNGVRMGTEQRGLMKALGTFTGVYSPSPRPGLTPTVDTKEVRMFLALCIAGYRVADHDWLDARLFEWRSAFAYYPAQLQKEICECMEKILRAQEQTKGISS